MLFFLLTSAELSLIDQMNGKFRMGFKDQVAPSQIKAVEELGLELELEEINSLAKWNKTTF